VYRGLELRLGRRSEAITELARTWYDLVEFYKQFESQQEKTDRYTTVPDHLKDTGVQLQYDENAALPSGRAEKVAGMQMREEAIGRVAERREAGREEKGSANKDHVFPRRPPPPPAVQQSGSESLLQTFVQTEAMPTKQEVLMKKTEQLSMYLTMLSNPSIPQESKSSITELFNNLTKELTQLQSAGSSSGEGRAGPGGNSGDGGGAGGAGPAGSLAPRRLNLSGVASLPSPAPAPSPPSAVPSAPARARAPPPARAPPARPSPHAASDSGSAGESPRRSPRRHANTPHI
jgi:hypothetical protein